MDNQAPATYTSLKLTPGPIWTPKPWVDFKPQVNTEL